MFGQRPFSVWEAEGNDQGTVALGFGWGSGFCWCGCSGSHRTWSDCRGCSSELTPPLPAAPAATAGLKDVRQDVKTDTDAKFNTLQIYTNIYTTNCGAEILRNFCKSVKNAECHLPKHSTINTGSSWLKTFLKRSLQKSDQVTLCTFNSAKLIQVSKRNIRRKTYCTQIRTQTHNTINSYVISN